MTALVCVEDNDHLTVNMFREWGYRTTIKAEEADLVVFTGGTDIDPRLYGEERGPYTDKPDVFRDKHCEHLYWNICSDLRKPAVGICRGAQFITVMQGGKLKQHITHHKEYYHDVVFTDGNKLEVTSSHHQEMVPTQQVDILGKAPDGTVEITFSRLNGQVGDLCVQGHPEWVDRDDPFQIWFIEQIGKLL